MKHTRKYIKLFLVAALSFNSFCSAGLIEIMAGLAAGAVGAESIWRIYSTMPHKLPKKDTAKIFGIIKTKNSKALFTKKLKTRILEIMAQDPNITNEAVADQVLGADDFEDLIKVQSSDKKRNGEGAALAPEINIAEIARLVALQLPAPTTSAGTAHIDYNVLVQRIMKDDSDRFAKLIAAELAQNGNLAPDAIARNIAQSSAFKQYVQTLQTTNHTAIDARVALQLAALKAEQKREAEEIARKKADEDKRASELREQAAAQRFTQQLTTALTSHKTEVQAQLDAAQQKSATALREELLGKLAAEKAEREAALARLKQELNAALETRATAIAAQAAASNEQHTTTALSEHTAQQKAALDDAIGKLQAQITALTTAQTTHAASSTEKIQAEVKSAIDAERDLRTTEHVGNTQQFNALIAAALKQHSETQAASNTALRAELLKKIEEELTREKSATAKPATHVPTAAHAAGATTAAGAAEKEAGENLHRAEMQRLISAEIEKQLHANPTITAAELTKVIVAMPDLEQYITRHNLKDSLIGQQTELQRLANEAATSYRTQLMQFKAEITGLMREAESAQKKKNGSLESLHDALKQKVDALEKLQATLTSSDETQQRSITQLLADKTQLEQRIAAEENARAAADTALDDKIKALGKAFETQLTALRTKQNENHREFEQFRDTYNAEARERREAEKKAKTAHDAAAAALTAKVAALESSQSQAVSAEALTRVTDRVGALDGRMTAFEASQTRFAETLTRYDETLAQLRTDLDAAKAADTKSRAALLATLEERVTQIQAQAKQLGDTAATAATDSSQLAALEKRIAELSAHVTAEFKKIDERVSTNRTDITRLFARADASDAFQKEQLELNKQFARRDELGGLYLQLAKWEEFSAKYKDEQDALRAQVDTAHALATTHQALFDEHTLQLKELNDLFPAASSAGPVSATGAAASKSAGGNRVEMIVNAILGDRFALRDQTAAQFTRVAGEQQKQDDEIARLSTIAGATGQLTSRLQTIVDLASAKKGTNRCAHCIVVDLAKTADAQMLLDMRVPIDERDAELKRSGVAKGPKGAATHSRTHATPNSSRRGSAAGISPNATPRLAGLTAASAGATKLHSKHTSADKKKVGEHKKERSKTAAACDHAHSPASATGASDSGSNSGSRSPATSTPTTPLPASAEANGGGFTFQPVTANETAFGSLPSLGSTQVATVLVTAKADAGFGSGNSQADSAFGTIDAATAATLTQQMASANAAAGAATNATPPPAKPALTVAVSPLHSPNASVFTSPLDDAADSSTVLSALQSDAAAHAKPKGSPTAAQLLAQAASNDSAAAGDSTALSLTAPAHTPPGSGLRAHATRARQTFVSPHSTGTKAKTPPNSANASAPAHNAKSAIGRGKSTAVAFGSGRGASSAPRGRGKGTVSARAGQHTAGGNSGAAASN